MMQEQFGGPSPEEMGIVQTPLERMQAARLDSEMKNLGAALHDVAALEALTRAVETFHQNPNATELQRNWAKRVESILLPKINEMNRLLGKGEKTAEDQDEVRHIGSLIADFMHSGSELGSEELTQLIEAETAETKNAQ